MTSRTHRNKNGLTVITTHLNADFDGLASMLAAQKLYPGAIVVFQGSSEKNLRNFFIDSMVYLFNMVDINDIDFDRVERLVLVDTRRGERIGPLAEVLKNPNLEIHIYDHHPPGDGDVEPHMDVHEPTGATTSILTRILKEKNIPISPEEATIMSLGIYEDTGSFTFSSTTEADFTAAAYLLSMGANLNIVADMVSRELSPAQVELLNDMIKSATHYKINGVEVVVSTISTEAYVPDFAFLAHKLQKMERIDALFAIARMGSKVYVVGRSRIDAVNAGDILLPLGGGGHSFAAAATVRDKTLAQTESELLSELYQNIRPSKRAVNLMSAPAITIAADMSCQEAGQLMTRYNVNALLVVAEQAGRNELLGFISRQVIEKALFHKLGAISVKEYMSTEIATVEPDADLTEIQEKIIEHKQRILPVVDRQGIRGVITRTDLLDVLVSQRKGNADEVPDPFRQHLTAKTRNVRRLMEERLAHRIIDILKSIGEIAANLGYNAYVIGGIVRDLFLYRPNEDIDIVVEGDGIEFAKYFAQFAGTRIHTHSKFGTAVIIYPDGFKIDVASARMEYYQSPAALPKVEMSSLKLDLFRRDFTINTLAIHLNPQRYGTLLDFFSAQRDIKEKVIRVLHNFSFVEDPTRVFRAIRFEQRFGFTLGKLTSNLIENAVKMDFFKRLSGRRVFSELKQILVEENPTPAVIRLGDYGLLSVIHPSIELNKKLITTLNAVKKVLAWYDLLFLKESYNKWAVYFLGLIHGSSLDISKMICQRLELAPRYKQFFSEERLAAERCLTRLEIKLPKTNSRLYQRMRGLRIEHILYMMAATKKESVERALSHYFMKLRYATVDIKGHDLIEMGVRPGPVFRDILNDILAAKLNGAIKNREEELAFARSRLVANGQIRRTRR